MPKRVTMVAEIIDENCTGCRLCVNVCATVAISMRPREEGEAGPGKNIAVMSDPDCYNIQSCLEICPDEAIVMRELDEPFEVRVDMESVDPDRVNEICRAAGFSPRAAVCPCTGTTAGELAAAVLHGASAPEELSRMTGVRTGCSELCMQPLLDVLAAGGNVDMERNPPNGFQWYGRAGTLFDLARPDGTFSPELEEQFSVYQPSRELAELVEASGEKRKQRKSS